MTTILGSISSGLLHLLFKVPSPNYSKILIVPNIEANNHCRLPQVIQEIDKNEEERTDQENVSMKIPFALTLISGCTTLLFLRGYFHNKYLAYNYNPWTSNYSHYSFIVNTAEKYKVLSIFGIYFTAMLKILSSVTVNKISKDRMNRVQEKITQLTMERRKNVSGSEPVYLPPTNSQVDQAIKHFLSIALVNQ